MRLKSTLILALALAAVTSGSVHATGPMNLIRLPWVDLSAQPERQVVVDRSPKGLGAPNTVLLDDGRTIVAGYPMENYGPGVAIKRSEDGGRTWSTRSIPQVFTGRHNGPVLHQIGNRLILMVPQPSMMQSVSEDGGVTWSVLRPLFVEGLRSTPGYSTSSGPISIVPISGGRLLALYHDRIPSDDRRAIGLIRIISSDGGRSWSAPASVGRHPDFPGAQPLEPCVIRSPDGKSLLCLVRENSHRYNALYMLSDDEGKTWSDLQQLPKSLTGHRYVMRYAPDGRLVVAFRDIVDGSPTYGDLVAWVGTYDDIVNGREGAYRARLVDNLGFAIQGGYSGLELLADGTFVSTTQAVLTRGELPEITSVRFTMADMDALLPTRGYTIPLIDLAADTQRQTIVDREPGQYLGHPTTVLLEDNRTMVAVYPKGHGRGPIVMKRSTDAGLTWSDRLAVPKNWETSKETPTIHRIVDRDGSKRLILFSGLFPIRMARSEDDGKTWSQLLPIGTYGGIVAMSSVERLEGGDHMALFHDDGRFIREGGVAGDLMTVYKVKSRNGGVAWSDPELIIARRDIHLCEPGLVRSPDGTEIAILLRENRRARNSFVMFSHDEGATFTELRELPAALTGDRHTARYAPDGRLFVSFRDMAYDSPTRGDWVGWVGTYDDLHRGTEGQYRVRLMDNKKDTDCGYPGVEVLPDGTFVTTSYGHWTEGEEPYIVTVRFDLDEIDARGP